jgi:hypothetical protein
MRIVGSGIGVTIMHLIGVPTGEVRTAIGTNYNGPGSFPLSGFEATDFTIDCGFNSAVASSGNFGVAIYGKDILFKRVRVINFGANNAGGFYAAINAAFWSSENVEISDCVVESPTPASSSLNQSKLAFYYFGGSTNSPHRLCTVRNCAGRGDTAIEPPPSIRDYIVGIVIGTGIGTVIDGNQLANVASAIQLPSLTEPTKDAIIWNNYARNVWKGIDIPVTSGSVGRLVITDNVFDLGDSLSNPVGISLPGNAVDRYGQVVLRKNLIRFVKDPAVPAVALKGIDVSGATNLIVENNIISNMTNPDTDAVRFQNCGSTKFFNNQSGAGALLRGYNVSTAKKTLELQDAVDDVLLPF